MKLVNTTIKPITEQPHATNLIHGTDLTILEDIAIQAVETIYLVCNCTQKAAHNRAAQFFITKEFT